MLRPFLRNTFLNTAGMLSQPKPGIHILNSHFVSPGNSELKYMITFMEQLRKKCSFIRFEDAVKMIIENSVPDNQALIAFSFDDGFVECYDIIAPVLEQFNTNAAFFIISGYIDNTESYNTHRQIKKDNLFLTKKKPMSWKQIRDLHKRGHIIGSHTQDHFDLNTTDLLSAEMQIKNCKSRIEDELGCTCDYFAYPYGTLQNINSNTLRIAQHYHNYIFSAANYKHYFSFNRTVINRRHIEPFWPQNHINYFLNTNKTMY